MSDKQWQKRFNRGGDDLTGMLGLQMEGKINSWAIRWVFTQSNLDMYTVYPKNSCILNDGCDGSGTHVGDTTEYQTSIDEGNAICKFENLEIDKKKIQLANPIKMTGELDVAIKLYPEVSTTLKVIIVAG